MCLLLNMSDISVRKFSEIRQGFEYDSVCNYGKVLNTPGFQVC